MEKFIGKEIEFLENYDFSFFKRKNLGDYLYKNLVYLGFLPLFLVVMVADFNNSFSDPPVLGICSAVALVVFSSISLYNIISFFILKIKINKIKEHLFIEEDEITKCDNLERLFNRRKYKLLVQYEKGEIDTEVLKELYLRKETRWKSL